MVEENNLIHPLENNLIHSFEPLGTNTYFSAKFFGMLKSISICYHFCSVGCPFSMRLILVIAEVQKHQNLFFLYVLNCLAIVCKLLDIKIVLKRFTLP